MRMISIGLVVGALLIGGAGAAHASAAAVPTHDGSRVGVQLVVFGVFAGVVVVVGSAAYFIRRRLGLTAPPPGEPPSGSGH